MTAVSVTAQHIAAGIPDSCCRCPVALAVAETFPDAEVRAVDGTFVTMGEPGKWAVIDLPAAAAGFIEAFDGGDQPGPFTFELAWPAVTP